MIGQYQYFNSILLNKLCNIYPTAGKNKGFSSNKYSTYPIATPNTCRHASIEPFEGI